MAVLSVNNQRYPVDLPDDTPLLWVLHLSARFGSRAAGRKERPRAMLPMAALILAFVAGALHAEPGVSPTSAALASFHICALTASRKLQSSIATVGLLGSRQLSSLLNTTLM